jgi:uncharacterized protein YhjY with autotransporter beta-barrel domain
MSNNFSGRAKARLSCGATVTILALGMAATPTLAQSCPGVNGQVCEISVSGTGQAVSTDGDTRIVNSGTNTSITQTSNDYLLIENQAGASIGTLTLAPLVLSPPVNNVTDLGLIGTTIVNSGTIAGNLVFASGGSYVNNGGTITGNLTGTNLSETFINRTAGGTGVGGTFDPGNGIDSFIQSLSASGAYNIPTTRPLNFEIAGVEALGAGTVVTVGNEVAGQGNAGLALVGNGAIVNQAIINNLSFAGSGLTGLGLALARPRAVIYGGEVGQNSALAVPTFVPSVGVVNVQIGYGSALTSFTNEGVINGDLLLRTATFLNSSEINLQSNQAGTLIFGAADKDFSFANTGTITMTDTGLRPIAITEAAVALATAIDATVLKAVNISNDGEIGGGLSFSGVASDFVFNNAGTISMAGNPNGIDRAVELEVGGLEVALNPDFRSNAATNSATIINSGTLDGGISGEISTKAFAFTNSGTISQDADDDEAEAVDISVVDYDLNGVEDIDADSASFTNTGTINGTVEFEEMEASLVTINNSGSIVRGLVPGATLFASGYSGIDISQETTLDATLNFTNSGTISTADYAGAGVVIDVEAGSIDSGNPAAATANATVTVVNSGTIAASGGSYITPGNLVGLSANELLLDIAVALAVNTDAEGQSGISITNQAGGIITARGPAHLGLPGGAQLIANQQPNASGVAVAAHADMVTIVNAGTILAGPGGPLTIATGQTLIPNVDTDSDIDFEGRIGSGIDTFGSVDDVTNAATGIIEGGIALRTGNDILRNYGSITGDVFMGDGDDSFIQGIRASFTGTADGGNGTDSLLIDITGGGTLNQALYDQFVSFENIGLTGTGAIDAEGPLPVETVMVQGGTLSVGANSVIQTQGATAITGSAVAETLEIAGTVMGNIDLGEGADSLANTGTITGAVDLGGGGDEVVLTGSGTFGSTVSGGVGTDSIVLATTGTDETPTFLALPNFNQFEILRNQSGTAALSGDVTIEQVNVTGGRLIGRAGSMIRGNVQIGGSATFGSAGQVVGNVSVGSGGTLSPGASPGTMTVTGDVALAANSAAVFELTPTVTDALLISGTLSIGAGSTLTLTGERPLTPGSSLDLIVADGGISGSFATITKPATILGFIAQNATRIQLLGQFAVPGGTSAQTAATIAYVNSVLVAGQGGAPLIAALPSLITAGGTNVAAFAQLHPEAYASASQIGVENGLSLSQAARSGNMASYRETAGFYSFAQGLGDWRTLKADGGTGVSRAQTHSFGMLGGLGFGSAEASVGAFIGHIDSRQRISGLGARTESDGIIAGVAGHVAAGGFDLSALLAYDGTDAATRRALPGGATATGAYKLHSWVGDASVGYSFPIGASWSVRPEAGFTHISTRRGSASETGGGAFNLNVDRRKSHATFVDGALALQGGREEGATFHPWLSAGVRHQLDGEASFATAALTGTTTRFTLPGAARGDTAATAGAGFSLDLVPQKMRFFASYLGEFGANGNSSNVNAGVRINF